MIKQLSLLTAGLLLSLSAFAIDVNALTQKANNGDVQAQMYLADYYRSKQDYVNEFYWEQQLANQGNANAQNNLGIMYKEGLGIRQDYKKAVEWYTKSANQGDADAQYNLGQMYRQGLGVRQDYKKAFEWYTKSANQGITGAQHNLGAMYHNGQGVRQNYKTAKEWFGKACNNGDQISCDKYRILNQQGY